MASFDKLISLNRLDLNKDEKGGRDMKGKNRFFWYVMIIVLIVLQLQLMEANENQTNIIPKGESDLIVIQKYLGNGYPDDMKVPLFKFVLKKDRKIVANASTKDGYSKIKFNFTDDLIIPEEGLVLTMEESGSQDEWIYDKRIYKVLLSGDEQGIKAHLFDEHNVEKTQLTYTNYYKRKDSLYFEWNVYDCENQETLFDEEIEMKLLILKDQTYVPYLGYYQKNQQKLKTEEGCFTFKSQDEIQFDQLTYGSGYKFEIVKLPDSMLDYRKDDFLSRMTSLSGRVESGMNNQLSAASLASKSKQCAYLNQQKLDASVYLSDEDGKKIVADFTDYVKIDVDENWVLLQTQPGYELVSYTYENQNEMLKGNQAVFELGNSKQIQIIVAKKKADNLMYHIDLEVYLRNQGFDMKQADYSSMIDTLIQPIVVNEGEKASLYLKSKDNYDLVEVKDLKGNYYVINQLKESSFMLDSVMEDQLIQAVVKAKEPIVLPDKNYHQLIVEADYDHKKEVLHKQLYAQDEMIQIEGKGREGYDLSEIILSYDDKKLIIDKNDKSFVIANQFIDIANDRFQLTIASDLHVVYVYESGTSVVMEKMEKASPVSSYYVLLIGITGLIMGLFKLKKYYE